MKKKVVAMLLTAVMAFSLAACGGTPSPAEADAPAKDAAQEAEAAPSAEGEAHVFGYTCMDLTNPFHIAMRDKLKEVIEGKGDILLEADGKNDQTKQNDAIEDMITQGMEVLFLNPVDASSVQPALEACEAKGIKVVNVDSGVTDTSKIATYISSDNREAGRQCGESIVERYPDGCNICLIDNPLADSVVERVAGLEEAIAGTECKIIDKKSYSTMDAVLGDVEDLLQTNSDVDVLWGLNDDFGLIMLGAVESAGLQDKIDVYAVDGSPSGKTSVQNGGLYATAAQSPVGLAEKALECAYTLLDGGTVDAYYALPTTLITPDNVADNVPDKWN